MNSRCRYNSELLNLSAIGRDPHSDQLLIQKLNSIFNWDIDYNIPINLSSPVENDPRLNCYLVWITIDNIRTITESERPQSLASLISKLKDIREEDNITVINRKIEYLSSLTERYKSCLSSFLDSFDKSEIPIVTETVEMIDERLNSLSTP